MVLLLVSNLSFNGPAAHAAPHATNPHTSVVFIHGFMGSSSNGANTMPNCGSYWKDAFSFLGNRWQGDLRQVSFYQNDCASNGNEQNYSANLHAYDGHCSNFYPGSEGTNNENLGHVACLLDWYLYYNFGQHGWEEAIVAHSMGGFIVRKAFQLWANHNSHVPSNIGHVTDVVDFNTPQPGWPLSGPTSCGNCVQGLQMESYDNFIVSIQNDGNAKNIQVNGVTDWTLIGSISDGLSYWGAVQMPANHKVMYVNPGYDHGGAIHDQSTAFDADVHYCDTTDPANNCNANIPGFLSSDWHRDSIEPHGLEDLYLAISSSSW